MTLQETSLFEGCTTVANIRRKLLFHPSSFKIIKPVLDLAVQCNSHFSLQEENTREMQIMHEFASGVIKLPPVWWSPTSNQVFPPSQGKCLWVSTWPQSRFSSGGTVRTMGLVYCTFLDCSDQRKTAWQVTLNGNNHMICISLLLFLDPPSAIPPFLCPNLLPNKHFSAFHPLGPLLPHSWYKMLIQGKWYRVPGTAGLARVYPCPQHSPSIACEVCPFFTKAL